MPRHGIGIDISTLAGSEGVVTTINDFVFESFSAGEMTSINTASRKQFARNNNDITGGTGYTKDTSITVPPGQTGTAIRVIEDTATSQHFAQTVIDEVTAGDTYTMSLYVKSTYSSITIYTNTTQISSNVTVNFTNGTVSANLALRAGIEDAGGGWYRINWTQVAQGSGSSSIYLVVKDLSSYTGSTSNFTDYFGMQVEQDSRASSFMLNTTSYALTVSTTLNDTSNVWDFDGTDIMIAEDPEDEGFWEESYPDGASLPELVLNGDYEELGSELVANGDFSLGTASFNEQLGVNFSVTSGVATIQSTGANSLIHQTISPPAVTTILQIEIDVVSFTGARFNVQFGGNSIEVTTTGKQFLLTSSSRSNNKMDIMPLTNETVVIRSISVKQVDPNSRWTLGTGWSIEDGKAKGAAGTQSNLTTANNPLTVGDTVEITYTISDYVAGSAKAFFGGGLAGTARTSNGTFTEINVVTTNGSFLIQKSADGNLSIDNVSVKEYAIQPLDI